MNEKKRVRRALCLAAVGMTCLSCAHTAAPDAQKPAEAATKGFAIEHVRVFDGERTLPDATVVVRDGRIAAVGSGVATPADVERIDGRGDTLLPGLIDAHVHLHAAEGLTQALAFGVTTELDMGTVVQRLPLMRQAADDAAHLAADFRSAGTFITAPGGHGTEYGLALPTLAGPADAQAFVDARIAEGSDYIKVILEDGSELGGHFPTLSAQTLKAVVEAAHRRGKQVVAHVGNAAEAQEAIDAGVDGLAHTFFDAPASPAFVQDVVRRHAFVVPTLTVLRGVCDRDAGADLLSDPKVAPYLTLSDRGQLQQRFPARCVRGGTEVAKGTVRALAQAGVPLLAGTDAPNPQTVYGASLHEELALLVSAGLTPAQALAAATSVPAARFHLADRGRIAPGLRADLILVRGDPTADIHATRDLLGIWKAGQRFDRDGYRAQVEATLRPRAEGAISDFEEGLSTRFGAGWRETTDALIGGDSTATLTVISQGAHQGHGALEVHGTTLPHAQAPWAGAMFFTGAQPMQPANLSRFKSLHFWVRGDGATYRVMLFSQHTGPMPRIQPFTASSDWTEVDLPLSGFELDGHDLIGIAFVAGPWAGPYRFALDDVELR